MFFCNGSVFKLFCVVIHTNLPPKVLFKRFEITPVIFVEKHENSKKCLRHCANKLGYIASNYNDIIILPELNNDSLNHRKLEAELVFLHKVINTYVIVKPVYPERV